MAVTYLFNRAELGATVTFSPFDTFVSNKSRSRVIEWVTYRALPAILHSPPQRSRHVPPQNVTWSDPSDISARGGRCCRVISGTQSDRGRRLSGFGRRWPVGKRCGKMIGKRSVPSSARNRNSALFCQDSSIRSKYPTDWFWRQFCDKWYYNITHLSKKYYSLLFLD